MTTKEAMSKKSVRVKILEWEDKSRKNSYPDRWVSKMPCGGGEYNLAGSSRRGEWQWFRNGNFVRGHYNHVPMTLEEAKLNAQSDYESRILLAIEETE